jgi:hypothetical protein
MNRQSDREINMQGKETENGQRDGQAERLEGSEIEN